MNRSGVETINDTMRGMQVEVERVEGQEGLCRRSALAIEHSR
jgi:hypothetical protein